MATTEQAPARPEAELVDRLAHPTDDEVAVLDAWWRANNYLTVGQIYLLDNPLLRESLTSAHIKPRLLGHWGTSPGLSFVYAHASRLIQQTKQQMIYLAGPGHGGPALVAASYLEDSYTETYPEVTQDGAGMRRLFRQFSAPGGIPSHVSVPTPGSIHVRCWWTCGRGTTSWTWRVTRRLRPGSSLFAKPAPPRALGSATTAASKVKATFTRRAAAVR